MAEKSFSERYGYRPLREALIYENVPEQVRQGLREVLTTCGYGRPSSQRAIICTALHVRPDPGNWSEFPNVDGEVDSLVHGCAWYTFYDMCQRIALRLTNTPFEAELNKLFREEGVGYVISEGGITKVGSEEFDESVKGAIVELAYPRFGVALQQFRKALDFRNGIPPDYPNAVKEAVNAVEGVWQIVTDKPGTALPTLLSSAEPPLPSGLKKLYDGLYGYGSGSEGARHAGVGGNVPEAEEAEFIIHSAAAAIRYAIRTYG
jgi:hypothetical protein